MRNNKTLPYYLLAFIGIIIEILFSCSTSSPNNQSVPKNNNQLQLNCNGIKKNDSNLNVNILLDLSDRINPKKHPNQAMPYYERDKGYINSIVQAFQCHIANKKLRKINDQIAIFFEPESNIPEINDIANNLKVRFNKNNVSIDKINNLTNLYKQNIDKIYQIAINQKKYDGSNIWGFFKNKVNDYIQKDKKNVLIIITDGYIYDKQNIGLKKNNKYANFTSRTIKKLGLNNENWEEIIKKNKIGILPANKDLKNLKVLVIGLHKDEKSKNPYEIEILKKIWGNWFEEMGIKNYEIKTADLPANLDESIKKFITE